MVIVSRHLWCKLLDACMSPGWFQPAQDESHLPPPHIFENLKLARPVLVIDKAFGIGQLKLRCRKIRPISTTSSGTWCSHFKFSPTPILTRSSIPDSLLTQLLLIGNRFAPEAPFECVSSPSRSETVSRPFRKMHCSNWSTRGEMCFWRGEFINVSTKSPNPVQTACYVEMHLWLKVSTCNFWTFNRTVLITSNFDNSIMSLKSVF